MKLSLIVLRDTRVGFHSKWFWSVAWSIIFGILNNLTDNPRCWIFKRTHAWNASEQGDIFQAHLARSILSDADSTMGTNKIYISLRNGSHSNLKVTICNYYQLFQKQIRDECKTLAGCTFPRTSVITVGDWRWCDNHVCKFKARCPSIFFNVHCIYGNRANH